MLYLMRSLSERMVLDTFSVIEGMVGLDYQTFHSRLVGAFRSRLSLWFLMLISLVLLREDGKPKYLHHDVIYFLLSYRSFHALDSKGFIHVWGAFVAISQ